MRRHGPNIKGRAAPHRRLVADWDEPERSWCGRQAVTGWFGDEDVAMPEDQIIIKLICRNLPGIRFEDPHPGQPPVREPVYLGIQVGELERDQEIAALQEADYRSA